MAQYGLARAASPRVGGRELAAVGHRLRARARARIRLRLWFPSRGDLWGVGARYHRRRYLEEREALAPILAGDPAFAGVEVHEKSDGGVFLTGAVPTPEDRERLRASVARALGEKRSKEAVGTEVRER